MAGRGRKSKRERRNHDQIRNTGATGKVNTGSGVGGPAGGARGNTSSTSDDGHVCPGCVKQVCDDLAVLCDRCKKWHHIHYEGMETSTYKALVSIIDNEQLHWYCGGCNVKILGISRDLEAAQELVAQLEDLTLKQNAKIADLENFIADNGYANGHGMEDELKDLSRKIDVLNETISFACINENKGTTYSDKIKKKKISEKKKEVAEVLKNIPIVWFSQTGNLVVNFLEECRDSAATLIQDNVGGAVTKKIKKLQPKIIAMYMERRMTLWTQ